MFNDADPPTKTRLVLDTLTRRSPDGTALIGGSPFRVLKLSKSGSVMLDSWLTDAADMPTASAPRALWQRIVDAGMAHPVPVPADRIHDIAAIVPVLDDLDGLLALLASLREALGPELPIVIVDDGSTNPNDLVDVAGRFGAEVVRHEHNRGPAAARNTGWSTVRKRWPTTKAVLFIDADVVIDRDALALLVAHLDADPALGVVAPRVAARRESGALHAYEAENSPLDMGQHPARVAARTRVSYVPSATMLVRTAVLEITGGFDADMRVGEDVDFVWRTTASDWTVRYEPRAVVRHRSRRDVPAFMHQRFAYGTSAAPLEQRHQDHVFPVELSMVHLGIWALAAFGRRWGKLGAGLAVASSVVDLGRKLQPRVDDAPRIAASVVADAHRFALFWLANAATRAWWPLLLFNRASRRGLITALVAPALVDWWSGQRALDPARFIGFRAVDHVAYGAGLWRGATTSRSVRTLLPRIRRH